MRKWNLMFSAIVLSAFMCIPAFAGTWNQSTAGWSYTLDDGSKAIGWNWIDGKCYCFDTSGLMYADRKTPDGYDVNADGQWIVNGVVQKKDTGTFITAASGITRAGSTAKAGDVCLPGADLTDTMGSGYVFSEQHPEITDPEYFLKEWYNYPHEGEQGILTKEGTYKTPYNNHMDEAFPLLQEFVHSFDWIHADEYTRYQKAFERIGAAYHGNVYDTDAGYNRSRERWLVLRSGHGMCEQFSNELAELCKLIGVQCEAYQSSAYHKRCLVKIGETWYVVDPTNNGYKNCKAVDYSAEKDRYKNEYFASEEAQKQREQLDLQAKAERGEISWREYYRTIWPDASDEQRQAWLGMTYDEYEKLCAQVKALH